ncbi:MAG TPA: hypothetical protein DCY64_22745 [Hydrogenophaga sp.]|nr:MAG: hypothetical protein A2X73_07585 [Burkholderiales bacterium GWE1_65_30]OGA89376.1 MAG: hypothetical protein A2X72_16745 [Burkholderiales bacterium GWF1_66_17]HAX23091.1 hypothetical protein [Hydrogenophaga sp.]HBU17044.1 hypothetical protein [Hydrogenophaga sp.]
MVRCKAATTTVADMDYWSHEISTFDAAYEELGASTMPDGQLLRFYGVGDYQTLVAAQAAHIEKLQAKVPRDNIPAFTTAREG